MRKILTFIGLGVLLLAGLAASLRAAHYCALRFAASGDRQLATPTMVLPIHELDLGTIEQGQPARAAFPISNQGTRRLVVVQYVKLCCGGGEHRQFIVQPGETQQLTVEVETDSWFGQMEKSVHLRTNDPSQARATLLLRANIVTPPQDERLVGSSVLKHRP